MSKAYVSAALKRLVCDRANFACEYCLMPEISVFLPHEIDHIIAEKHGGQTNENNLALACTICNKYKGSDLASIDPLNGEIVRLYHPRRDRWREHFKLEKGEILRSPREKITRTKNSKFSEGHEQNKEQENNVGF